MTDRIRAIIARSTELVGDLPAEFQPAAFRVVLEHLLQSDKAVEETLAEELELRTPDSSDTDLDLEAARAFLAEHHRDKPAENVKAIAAFLYGEYGNSPFTVEDVTAIAHEAGVTVPARVDKTLSKATSKNKRLFTKVKAGVYKPTVHGEAYLKEAFSVAKGTGRRT